jgi:hypothetical protein
VAKLAGDAEEIAKLILAAYGPDDPRAVRPQDICDSIQRFQWAMARGNRRPCQMTNP